MHSDAVHTMLSALPGKRVLVVGDVMLDEYLWGEAARLSAEAPVPVVEIGRRSHVPGGAANVAVNIAALGGTALLAGVVGKDANAGRLADGLQRQHVDASGLIAQSDRPTTTKTRLIASGQQVVRMDEECRDAVPRSVEDALVGWVARHLVEVDSCVLSDYGKGVVSSRVAEQVVEAARHAGKPVIVDPKGADYRKYRRATVIKPNIREVERCFNEEIHGDAALIHAGTRLVSQLEGCAVLITRGGDGMSLFRRDSAPWHVEATANHVFDATGAGDTVVASLAMFLAVGVELELTVAAANLAAGIAVGKRGTAAVTAAELVESIAGIGRDSPGG